jgi:hypothetical protein
MVKLKGLKGFGVVAGALGLFAAGFMVPGNAHAGKALTRLAASVTANDGNAIDLPPVTPAAGPTNVYTASLKVPPGNNVAYVTVSGTGLGGCDGIAINCQIDGVNCFTGIGATGFPTTSGDVPAGWVVPNGNEFGTDSTYGLNALNYTFCAPITKGTHVFTVNAATELGDCDTFIEALSTYVDVNKIATTTPVNVCGSYATPNPVVSPD